MGTIILCISFNIRRYRALIKLWAILAVIMGLVLLGIDLSSGLPTGWTSFEGPMTMVMDGVLFWSQHGIGEDVANQG